MKIIYVHCGDEMNITDPRSGDHYWTSSWNKKKNSDPFGIWTYDLCDTGAALYQLRYHAN